MRRALDSGRVSRVVSTTTVRLLRAGLTLLASCALLLTSVAVCAKQNPAGPLPGSPVAADQDDALAQRIAAARDSGIWVVQEGDHLYRIARHFFPTDRVMIERMREQLIARNSHAFMAGKPALLIVGARLQLPLELMQGRAAAPAATSNLPGGSAASASLATSVPAPKGTAATTATAATIGTPASPALTAKAASPPIPSTSVPAAGEPGKTVITLLDPNTTTPAPAAPRPRPAYVDKLIEGVSQADETGGDAAESVERMGRRTLSIGHAQAVRDRTEGTSREHALDLRLSFETMDHGDFRLDTQWIRFTPGESDLLPRRKGFNATLYHSQFALPGGVTADSAAGVVRSIQPLWLSSSQRVVLPTTLLSGVTSRLGGERGEVRFALGEPGRLAGIGILDFERTSGRFATVSGSYLLAPGIQAGGAVLRLTGSQTIPDHTAATAAVEFWPSTALRGKAQFLANAGGKRGAWSDWEFNQNRWRHRTGAYQLDADLLYGDSRPQNDVRGVYWRSDLRQGFNTYVLGAEISQTNIRNDPARSGTSSDGVYGSVALRIDRRTSVGAGLSYRQDRPRQGSGDSRNVAIANAFASRQTALGFTRVDGTVNRTRSSGAGDETIGTLQLSHDFPRWNQLAASAAYSATRESLVDGRLDRRVASLSLRGPLWRSMLWDATVSWIDVEGEGQTERGYNANVGIDWPISANWAANLSWQRNQVRPGADNPLNPFRRENTVLLSVRYDIASGTPYPRLIGAGGRQGTGTIVGFVFYDENGDGVRQPSERGAENILLVLDGRFAATTNRDGYFNFGAVSLGTHAVAVQLEKVPLPWGLADEAPRQVVVRLREESRVDIGLTRISP
ncbi:MAG: hypothetical protein SF172_15300 [Burkholderiales bacterium]|nr:hypothetical protein [Burkholderiales bacterium]